jgi:hypothetical protein
MDPWQFPIVGGPTDPYWADWINRGIDVVGARVGQGRYISPDDPRFRGQFPGGGTIVPSPGGPAFVPGTVGAQGFQINWWAAALAGVVLGAFLLGKRGR